MHSGEDWLVIHVLHTRQGWSIVLAALGAERSSIPTARRQLAMELLRHPTVDATWRGWSGCGLNAGPAESPSGSWQGSNGY